MLAALPFLALGGCVFVCHRQDGGWRQAILQGAVLWGAVLVGSPELLSLFGRLTQEWLSMTWLLTLACLAVALVVNRRQSFAGLPRVQCSLEVAFYGPLAAIVLILGTLTVATAPNTWDAMTYHLARVIHWQQDATLAPYPTHILRQLYLQPGAEEVIFNLQVLSGGDRLAGAVQWASMVGALVGTSLIATELAVHRAGVMCAIAFAVSIPIGVLESTSTQNDYVVTFWLVCMVALALRLLRSRSPSPAPLLVVAIAASLGLALLTKATAYLVATPYVVWFTTSAVSRWRWRALRALPVLALVVLALNTGFFVRNVTVFGSPMGPPDEGAPSLRYLNDAFTPALLTSNVVRDLGVNLVATPLAAINVRSFNLVRDLHVLIGADIQDPRTTWGGELFREQRVDLAFDENFAGNPVHLLVCMGALLAMWPLRHRTARHAVVYTTALVSGLLLFAAVLRWQPWDTRLELPWFVLAAPLIGLVCELIGARFALCVASLLLMTTLPWVMNNQARPLVGPRSALFTSRTDQYFAFQRDLQPAYTAAVAFLADHGCTRIGFISNQDGWEYPLRALSAGGGTIEHVAVTNVSADVSPTAIHPCAVLALGIEFTNQAVQVGDQTFRRSWSKDDVVVLTPDDA